jgi:hypothetical protein
MLCLAAKRCGDRWYNLDSKLEQPVAFTSDADFATFLEQHIGRGAELMLVQRAKEPPAKTSAPSLA